MKAIPQFLILLLYSFLSIQSIGQSSANDIKAARQMVDEEQKVFKDFLMTASINPNIKKSLQRFAVNDVNSLQNNLQFLATAPRDKRIKAIRSLSYFMKELQQQLKEDKINQLNIPEILKAYKQTLNDLLDRKNNEAIEKDFKNLNWRNGQLLANAFWEFDEKKQMTDISAYKRVVETPEYIFSFLESKPGFYYTDSLIVFMAKNYPEQLLSYLQKNNNAVANSIRNQKNIYVQQLVAFSSNSLASELAPFTVQIAYNELTINDVLEKRKKVNDYFQLLVNTAMSNEQKKQQGDNSDFETALMNALSKKSLDFYVTKINDLHSSTDAARFQSVQTLRPQDLYYIIVSADEEMYTSTYLGLYKRLLGHFKDQAADSVLSLVHNDKFRKFMRIAATYNTLSDFLHHMPQENSRQLIHLFIADIENSDEEEAISDAVDIADAFITLSKDPGFNSYVRQELEDGLQKSKKNNQYQSERLYSILQRVYNLVNNDQSENNLSANYKRLPFTSLKDKKGNVSELVIFYGDEDGKSSYGSFMSLFKDKSQWEVSTNDSWVTISSLKGQPIKIYANLPLNTEDEKDIAAQEALVDFLEKESIQPSVLIHRGHSYHLPNTLKYLYPSVKLAILGSCGGYKNMKKIMEINPDVHIIASKQVGSMAVNDPLLRHLNNYLTEGRNIDWVNFWNELNGTFKAESTVSKLFEEYIPPYKNVSSYVIRLYNYHDQRMASKQ
ncbi:MAG TPA: hypothetical protein VGQ09_06825 [Chitinophagaceae bacterium]|jgi:hypothetical protein|nr:hypothetical protein [Chitinophagaceae bacterium]